jgi:hypothetical protein
MESQVKDHPEKGRFELDIDGQIAFARYARQGATHGNEVGLTAING